MPLSPVIGPAIAVTLALFVLVYGIVFATGIYYINRLIARGLDAAHDRRARGLARRHAGRRRPRAREPADDRMEWSLPLIWAGVIGSAVAMYVILDGFDLGIGILFPFANDDKERDQMMARSRRSGTATRPGWCWAAAACWSRSRSPMRSSCRRFYLPVIVMLLALVFRGVAFEFRGLGANKALWNFAFAGGSTLAGFARA